MEKKSVLGMGSPCYLLTVTDPLSIITPIENGALFPSTLRLSVAKYRPSIQEFRSLVAKATSSSDLLREIRCAKFSADDRMSLLKIFRRCVSLVCDTKLARN